jgi:hypothetical protein
MSATGPLGAISALAIALLTVYLLQQRFGIPPPPRRFATLDGLRGYAAFLVFLHHTAIWYFFARTGTWALPPSRLRLKPTDGGVEPEVGDELQFTAGGLVRLAQAFRSPAELFVGQDGELRREAGIHDAVRQGLCGQV